MRATSLTDEQFRAAVTGQLPQSYIDLLCALYSGVRAGWTERQTDDMREVLGRDPISLAQFIRDHCSVWS